MTTIKYQAYEHNDGGLYLVIYDQRGRPVWAGCDYELRPGSLRQAIIDIDDWSYDWSRGGYQDTDMTLEQIATELHNLSAKRDSGVHLIADQDDVYPDRMGASALLDMAGHNDDDARDIVAARWGLIKSYRQLWETANG